MTSSDSLIILVLVSVTNIFENKIFKDDYTIRFDKNQNLRASIVSSKIALNFVKLS